MNSVRPQLFRRKHTIHHNVSFRESYITEATNAYDDGVILYDVASAYVVLDKDTAATSNLKRSTSDLSLSWSGDKKSVTHGKAMPSHLKLTDMVANLSPEYLSAIGTFNDEMTLVLAMMCSEEQIAHIFHAGLSNGGKDQCTVDEMGHPAHSDCACCMLEGDFEALKVQNTGTDPDFTRCDSFLDEESYLLSTLSLLAFYDGGVAVKEAGEDKYDGSGNKFVATKDLQTSVYSAAVQTHTINDLMFGYPSAFIGKTVSRGLLSTARKAMLETTNITADVATMMLMGQMDNQLPFKLGNMAEYTKKVEAVSAFTREKIRTSCNPLL